MIGVVTGRRIPCVGAIAFSDAGRLLMIRRANPPAQGLWSIPGGRVEPGEDLGEAVLRELLEETGVVGRLGRAVGTVERAVPAGTYVIYDYLVHVDGEPIPIAGDDALEARWVEIADLLSLPTSEGLVDALSDWGLIQA